MVGFLLLYWKLYKYFAGIVAVTMWPFHTICPNKLFFFRHHTWQNLKSPGSSSRSPSKSETSRYLMQPLINKNKTNSPSYSNEAPTVPGLFLGRLVSFVSPRLLSHRKYVTRVVYKQGRLAWHKFQNISGSLSRRSLLRSAAAAEALATDGALNSYWGTPCHFRGPPKCPK